MKRIIGILLALLLVLTGLGNINYAQSDTSNEVHLNFTTEWAYPFPGDSFSNGMVAGRLQIFDAAINNSPDGTGDVAGASPVQRGPRRAAVRAPPAVPDRQARLFPQLHRYGEGPAVP